MAQRRAYAVYIIHPPVLVGVSLLLHPWVAPALLKFCVTGLLACVATWLACRSLGSHTGSAPHRITRAPQPWHRPCNLLEAPPHLTFEEDSYGNEEGSQKEIKQREEKQPAKKSTAKKSAAKKSSSRKYSPSAGKNVETEMKEMKKGKLKSGRSGKKVTSRKQAIAIGLSKARKEGKKVPAKEILSAFALQIFARSSPSSMTFS